MEPIHLQVLDAALACAADDGSFRVADVIRTLPHLNAATVRTHVASRCCVNAPAHHQSRYPYFRALARGVYSIRSPYLATRSRRRPKASQDRILAALPSGVDPTLLDESLAMTPTERLETMRRAAHSLEGMRPS